MRENLSLGVVVRIPRGKVFFLRGVGTATRRLKDLRAKKLVNGTIWLFVNNLGNLSGCQT